MLTCDWLTPVAAVQRPGWPGAAKPDVASVIFSGKASGSSVHARQMAGDASHNPDLLLRVYALNMALMSR
jgi:hypothetical protein